MISLGLKSTLARTLAVFSVITLCSTSFAKIKLKPSKQQTTAQTAIEKTEEQATELMAAESSNGIYYFVASVVAGVMVYFGAKQCFKSKANADIDLGNDRDDNHGNGENRWFSAQGAEINGDGVNPLFRQLGDHVARQAQDQQPLQVEGGGVANPDAQDAVRKAQRQRVNYASPDGSPKRTQPTRVCK